MSNIDYSQFDKAQLEQMIIIASKQMQYCIANNQDYSNLVEMTLACGAALNNK